MDLLSTLLSCGVELPDEEGLLQAAQNAEQQASDHEEAEEEDDETAGEWTQLGQSATLFMKALMKKRRMFSGTYLISKGWKQAPILNVADLLPVSVSSQPFTTDQNIITSTGFTNNLNHLVFQKDFTSVRLFPSPPVVHLFILDYYYYRQSGHLRDVCCSSFQAFIFSLHRTFRVCKTLVTSLRFPFLLPIVGIPILFLL